MSVTAQPAPQNVAMGYQCGYIQLGQEMFVQINVQSGSLAHTLFMPIDNAKQFAKAIREAAETAEVQIIKPASMLAPN